MIRSQIFLIFFSSSSFIIWRISFKNKYSQDELLEFLNKNTILNEEYKNILANLYSSYSEKEVNKVSLSLHSLRNLNWSISLKKFNNQGKEINIPYVHLEFEIKSLSNKIEKKQMDLSLKDFKVSSF